MAGEVAGEKTDSETLALALNPSSHEPLNMPRPNPNPNPTRNPSSHGPLHMPQRSFWVPPPQMPAQSCATRHTPAHVLVVVWVRVRVRVRCVTRHTPAHVLAVVVVVWVRVRVRVKVRVRCVARHTPLHVLVVVWVRVKVRVLVITMITIIIAVICGGKPVGFGVSASLVVREVSPGVVVTRESVVTATVLGLGLGLRL